MSDSDVIFTFILLHVWFLCLLGRLCRCRFIGFSIGSIEILHHWFFNKFLIFSLGVRLLLFLFYFLFIRSFLLLLRIQREEILFPVIIRLILFLFQHVDQSFVKILIFVILFLFFVFVFLFLFWTLFDGCIWASKLNAKIIYIKAWLIRI